MRLVARGQTIVWPRRPVVMGIVNLCADSFSGDGLTDVEAAQAKARALVAEGAEIIDIGAESARTNRAAISEEEEAEKLGAFIRRWSAEEETLTAAMHDSSRAEGSKGETLNAQRSTLNAQRPLLSINTWRPAVVRAALADGGHILNDIGGLPTDENARVCAETGAALLIMHTLGAPKVPQTHVAYDDVMARLGEFFAEKIALAESAGLSREALILDPGIDFAKQREDNLRVFRELDRLHDFARPILLPVSRKTVIGEVLGLDDPRDRDAGTVACIVQGMLRGAHLFRVHNVRAAVQTVRMIEAAEAMHVGDGV